MKVLKQSTEEQEFKFIPREYPNLVDVIIRREQTKTEIKIEDIPVLTLGGYGTISRVFDLVEDEYYTITILNIDSDDVIYKDKIFCTNQINYSILNGDFTSRGQNKKYAVR